MDVYFLFGFLLSIWTFCGFQFCYKTSVLTMSSQDKIKRKSTEEKCFCRLFFTDCLPLFVKWRQGCLSLDEDLLLLRMPVFLHNSRITSYGSSFLGSFEDFSLLMRFSPAELLVKCPGKLHIVISGIVFLLSGKEQTPTHG